MSWTDLLGYAASGTVLATFCMTSMRHLRLLAIGSNVLFILFGSMAHIYPVLLLHIILLPVNLTRLMHISKRPPSIVSQLSPSRELRWSSTGRLQTVAGTEGFEVRDARIFDVRHAARAAFGRSKI
jgi:hypothetical protein